MIRKSHVLLGTLLTVVLGLAACKKEETPPPPPPPPPPTPAAPKTPGVDAATKTVRIGALNDESGPAAAIGKPFAVGKRVLAASVNAGPTGLLPDGWKVELVERDHGYNPQQAVQAYKEIKDQIYFVGTSFGTPNTLPLLPMLQQDEMVAFSASLSSELAQHELTAPIGASYKIEARRAMDWAVTTAGNATKVKAAIVYQQDDYGADGLAGWKESAALHGVTVVSEQPIAAGQSDFTAVVTALKAAGANYVLLTTLPSATGPILGTAAQLGFKPTWIGNTPSWIDGFFNAQVLPAAVLANFYWVNGLPFWGEQVPGMDKFLAAYEAHGKNLSNPDFYVLVSYIQGLVELEAAKRAITTGDFTRKGYLNALHTLEGFDAGGMIQPLNLKAVPYVTGTRTRVLKPKLAEGTWEVKADYAEPLTEAFVPGAAPKPKAQPDERPVMEESRTEPNRQGPPPKGETLAPRRPDRNNDTKSGTTKTGGDKKPVDKK